MKSDEVVSINGEILDLRDGRVSVRDHCLLFGDGVFEGIRFINKKVLLHQEHLKRLYQSAAGIRLPMVSEQEYKRHLFSAVEASSLESGYIRVVATRGIGELDLNPTKCVESKLIIIVASLRLFSEQLYEKGIRLIVAKTTKVPARSFNCRIKSCNYLSNVMALWESIDRDASEAIVTDENGMVSEATMTNIFGIKNGNLFTPGLETNCLAGITRAKVIEIATTKGITVNEGLYTPDEFMQSDEVFLTGTGAGILPVNQIESTRIGEGIGQITRLLRSEYEQRLGSYYTPIT